MPYRCRSCRKHLSVRTGTLLAESKLPVLKWLMAVYLITSSSEGHIECAAWGGVTQKTTWFLAHRVRATWATHGDLPGVAVEVDETFAGEKNETSTLASVTP